MIRTDMVQFIAWPTFVVLIIAVVTDLRSGRIPNVLVVPFLAVGLLAAALSGGWAGVARSLTGMGIAAVVMGLLCYLRGMGLGDAKLFAAVAAWIGPAQTVSALVMTAMAGGFLALAGALWRGSLGRSPDSTAELQVGLRASGFQPCPAVVLSNANAARLPYAAAIAMGTMLSFYAV